ncbi:MAG: PEP-CTERM sorting domain-containing protein [Candidatus Spyradosoma sp.]
MKNIITVAALLAAGTAFANAELTSTTGTDGSYTSTGVSSISGFYVDLDLLTWNPSISKATTSTLILDSITFTSTSSANSSNSKFYSGELYAFIYEGQHSETDSGFSSLTAVAHSTNSFNWNSNSTANASGTWQFSDVSLDLTKSYSILFSSSGDSFVAAKGSGTNAEGIRSSITTTLETGVTDPAVKVFTTSPSNTTLSSNSGVNVSFSGRISTIPEPSAFGLLAGAGALALVAARRRRRKA